MLTVLRCLVYLGGESVVVGRQDEYTKTKKTKQKQKPRIPCDRDRDKNQRTSVHPDPIRIASYEPRLMGIETLIFMSAY